MAHDRVSSWDIRRAALAEGMRPLRMDAWDKAIQGMTSIDEVVRLTKSDRI
jgi:general secretion pathway protein E/type IV pilus assembly protein PilB